MNYKYKILVADIETNAIKNWQTLEGLETCHCISVIDVATKELYEFNTTKDNIEDGLKMLQEAEYVCGHNFIGFDAPALFKLFGVRLNKIVDTYIMSKVMFPALEDYDHTKKFEFPFKGMWDRHKLAAWGVRVGEHKSTHGETEDWTTFTPEMQKYCNQDVRTNLKVYEFLLSQPKSSKSLVMEHEFAQTLTVQELNGFPFDVKKANKLAKELTVRRAELEKEVQAVFPPKKEEMKQPKGWKVEVEGYEYEAKTKTALKKILKDAGLKQSYANDAEKTGARVKTIPFNPASRDQIAERLMAAGWRPKAYEGKRPAINEAVLKEINTTESLKLLEYNLVNKRLGMLLEGKYAWLRLVTDEGRIHGSIDSCAAISTRCTHSKPNMAQIPAVRSIYGEECRELFMAPEGKVLVGADAKSIELRVVSEYLYPFDAGAYAKEVVEGDIHQANADAIGVNRGEGKTFIYALLYGAGNQKLGEIVGKGMREGKRLRNLFMTKLPAFQKLIDAVHRSVATTNAIKTIDDRMITVRSQRSSLNLLIQSAGSIIMKQAAVCFRQDSRHPYEMHANVHDEVQFSCLEEHSEDLGNDFCNAIKKAGQTLNLKVPFEGDFKVGKNWKETH